MDFLGLAKSRYSVRSFTEQPVEDEKLGIILGAGQVAPTACNNQPQKIYVLKSDEALKKLENVCRFVFGAKTVLLVAADRDSEWKNPLTDKYRTGEIDCSIVCTHMMMQAWELGIGSCWVGYFDPDKVATQFELPANEQIIAILPLGYPSAESRPSRGHYSVKPLDETVKYL